MNVRQAGRPPRVWQNHFLSQGRESGTPLHGYPWPQDNDPPAFSPLIAALQTLDAQIGRRRSRCYALRNPHIRRSCGVLINELAGREAGNLRWCG